MKLLDMQSVTVLTYHRIVPEPEVRGFYDISVSSFERQVVAVAERSSGSSDGLIELEDGRWVCFTFDDGTADHYRAADILVSAGLPGTFFVVSGWLDSDGYLRSEQLADMRKAGHRIGSHTVNHRHLTDLSSSELEYELSESKRILEMHCGDEVNWFAPPGGIFSDYSLAAAQSVGYKVFRTMDWGYNRLPLVGRVSCLPVFRSYKLNMFNQLLDGNAPLWRYAVKSLIKKWVPDALYTRLRNFGAALLNRLQ